MKEFKYLILFVLCSILLGSCQEDRNQQLITMGFVSWEENAAIANLTKSLLEQEGYQVKFRHADIDPIFKQLFPKKKIDVFMDVWMPVTHQKYMKDYGQNLEILGTSYTNAKTGLVVPQYMDIETIEELNTYKKELHFQITGIDAGAGIMTATESAIKAYHLELELIPSTNFAMATALRKAIDQNEPIVVTGWTPHSLFAEYNLKFLSDPKDVYGSGEKIQSVGRQGFTADFPRAAELIKNIQLTETEFSSLLENLKNAKHDFEGVEKWMANHQEIIQQWLPSDSIPLINTTHSEN